MHSKTQHMFLLEKNKSMVLQGVAKLTQFLYQGKLFFHLTISYLQIIYSKNTVYLLK